MDPLPAIVAECGTLCVIPAYVPPHWYKRLTAEIDDKGTHIMMGGWNNGEGHAKCRMAGKATYAYRWVYEQVTGRKLSRLNYIDHICERKPCIVFEHLEPTTPGVNTWRQHMARTWATHSVPPQTGGPALLTLDEIVTALPGAGFRLKNLFQSLDGAWEAHVNDASAHPDTYTFGRAAAPADAIGAALKAAGVKIED